jgi:hypothetical protein
MPASAPLASSKAKLWLAEIVVADGPVGDRRPPGAVAGDDRVGRLREVRGKPETVGVQLRRRQRPRRRCEPERRDLVGGEGTVQLGEESSHRGGHLAAARGARETLLLGRPPGPAGDERPDVEAGHVVERAGNRERDATREPREQVALGREPLRTGRIDGDEDHPSGGTHDESPLAPPDLERRAVDAERRRHPTAHRVRVRRADEHGLA